MKKNIINLVLLIIASNFLLANGSAGESATHETRYIIDMPTAGMLQKYEYNINSRVFANGGISTEFNTSLFNKFMLGIAYSANSFIGDGEPTFQGIPGFDIRYRIIDEKMHFPAITLGARTQGNGGYIKSEKRFRTHSPGIFVAVSKSFLWFMGETALHGGINYSFDPDPVDRFPNIYAGFEITTGPFASIVGEFNANIDDKDDNITKQQGLLNAGVRFSITNSVTIDLLFRDLLKSRTGYDTPRRSINFEFISSF